MTPEQLDRLERDYKRVMEDDPTADLDNMILCHFPDLLSLARIGLAAVEKEMDLMRSEILNKAVASTSDYRELVGKYIESKGVEWMQAYLARKDG